MAGTREFLAAATDAGTNRIVFADGPAALGWKEWREIDDHHAPATLRAGLSSAFNEAALGLGNGRYDRAALEQNFKALFEGLRA
jgi:hypothetical protein